MKMVIYGNAIRYEAMLGTWLFTIFKGKQVGSDYYGNRYFVEKSLFKRASPRRWVMYKGDNEASKVVPEWHRWLHRVTDDIPTGSENKKDWQQTYQPNLTGTAKAYAPQKTDKKQYKAWEPK